MKKVILLILLLSSIKTFSQGFDWQYSFRLPYSIPTKFIGITSGYSINSSRGNFEFLEDYTPCCNYQSGQGSSINLGIVYENWITPLSSISLSISYQSTQALFNQTIQVPRSDGINDYIAKYRYEMDESRSSVNIIANYKHRIFDSHWSVLGGINLHYNTGKDANHTEEIIAPENERFIDGTRKRTIKRGMYGEYNLFGLNPIIGINYDIPILQGYYTSLSTFLQIPITNVVKNENWKEWKFQFSISILKSID